MERELACPHCGRINQLHEDTKDGGDPKPGAIGICWQCHGLAVLTPFLFLRKPTEQEAAEFAADPDIKRALAAMSEAYTPSQATALLRRMP